MAPLDLERMEQITSFVRQSPGLELTSSSPQRAQILQKADGKVLTFEPHLIEEVIPRNDSGGQGFLQINFNDGRKILLTETLVGFKPAHCVGLDMEKLPKVVTTPDLISVVEALEESLHAAGNHQQEIEVLRRVFDSVLRGGEAIGFDLTPEKAWLLRLTKVDQKSSA
jgi:hypothetical protein